MELHYNVTGTQRKEMVGTIVSALGMAAVYKGAPTFAYAVGNFTVAKDGTLEFDGRVTDDELQKVREKLAEAGFTATEEPEEDFTGTELNIEVPREGFTDEAIGNLEKIKAGREQLFMKAFGTDDLRIEVTDDKISFPWFKPEEAGEAQTYARFIGALCRMAKEQKRINIRETSVESEKFAMRTFLRLGFIGAEYKEDRRILLKNLTGSAAFPTKEAADAFSAKQKAKREEAKA